jgi:flavin reductase (DIM6/NTAB) family NADH-FMN oxidoreductase RutF
MSAVDTRTFFDIMGTAPAAVTVVTTVDATGHPRGMTVAAVSSVSAHPPSLLISVDLRSRTLPNLRQAGRFAVNFLRGDRAEISRRFASPMADRFEGVEWQPGPTGMPILHADSLSWAECRIQHEIKSGDHVILIAAVEAGSPPPPLSRPLMYFRHHHEAWSGEVADARHVPAAAVATASPRPRTTIAVSASESEELGPV